MHIASNLTDRDLILVRAKLDHDLRSNLNVILGFSAMLKEELTGHKLQSSLEDIDCIASAGREVLHLNDQIEDLTRLQLGTWTRAKEGYELRPLLEDVTRSIQERHANHEISVIGSAICENLHEVAINHVFDLLVSTICKSTIRGTRIEAIISEAHVDIVCAQNDEAFDIKRIDAVLERLTTPVTHMSDIRDFEGYYLTTVCDFIDIRITRIHDQLAIRMELIPTHEAKTDNNENSL